MLAMAKHGKPPEKKKPVRTGVNLNVWIDPQVHAALDAYVESHEPKTTLTAVVELAIKRYLREIDRARTTDGD
jgi:hypothetical protein